QKCIRRSDFKDKEMGMELVLQFVDTWNSNWAHPFNWKFTVGDLEKLLCFEEQIILPISSSFIA
ncbi:MAG: hypothetical protein Q7I94_07865, partial [Candidatus Contubernalis sp.]|nr:hypothetical protein [Candidatus Contubernalis sp.]